MADVRQEIETQDAKPEPQPTLQQLKASAEGMETYIQRDRSGGKNDPTTRCASCAAIEAL